jgi:hypothetical protein
MNTLGMLQVVHRPGDKSWIKWENYECDLSLSDELFQLLPTKVQ